MKKPSPDRPLHKLSIWAVLWAAFAVGLLVAAVVFLFNWRTTVGDSDRYRAAPICNDGKSLNCRWQEWVTVVDIRFEGNQTSHVTFAVRLSDGDTVDLVDHEEGRLYEVAEIGSQVIAEFWNGEIVTLQSASGRAMRTQYDPDWKSRDNLTSGIASGIAAPVFAYLAYIASRRRRF